MFYEVSFYVQLKHFSRVFCCLFLFSSVSIYLPINFAIIWNPVSVRLISAGFHSVQIHRILPGLRIILFRSYHLCPKLLNEIKPNLKYGQNLTVSLTENRNRVKILGQIFEKKKKTNIWPNFEQKVKNLRSNPFKSFGHWSYSSSHSCNEYFSLLIIHGDIA